MSQASRKHADRLLSLLGESDAVACWHGRLFKENETASRQDATYLLQFYRRGDSLYFRRTPLCRDEEVDKEPRVCIPATGAFKQLDGVRRNSLLRWEHSDQELCENACFEVKVCGNGPGRQLSTSSPSDRFVHTLLSQLPEKFEQTPVFPVIYLTYQQGSSVSLALRNGAEEKYPFLPAHATGYAMLGRVNASLDKIPHIETCGDRIGIPYEDFYGRGVIAVDYGRNRRWFMMVPGGVFATRCLTVETPLLFPDNAPEPRGA